MWLTLWQLCLGSCFENIRHIKSNVIVCFYYDVANHYLNSHVPYQDKDSWCSISNVECEIKMDKPLIYIYAKKLRTKLCLRKN